MKTVFSLLMLVPIAMGMTAMGVSASASADTAATFASKCATCHGKDGKGDTPMGRKLNMRNLADPKVQEMATDAQWQRVILEGVKGGGGKAVMPPAKVTEPEAQDLVKYLRTLKK
jgi:mono/diheme cytochrome c family protein